MALVYLGIGSNIEPLQNLAHGLSCLRERFQVLAESPWYQSPARGFVGPDFINLVVAIEFAGELLELAEKIKQLEKDCGRPENAQKYSSRTLDIDILLFANLAGEFAGITLPRTDISQCAYVLKPLLDIAPDLKHPVNQQPYQQLWPELNSQPLELVRT